MGTNEIEKILMDLADGYREGTVIRVTPMPNLSGRFIITVKPIGWSGLITTYEISNILPRGIGWEEYPRPDGKITFVLRKNESGESPFSDKLGIDDSEARVKLEEIKKTMAIREKAASTKERKYSENVLSIVNDNREILDAWEKKKNNPNDPQNRFRNPNM